MNPGTNPALTSLLDQIEASSAHTGALLAEDGRRIQGPISMQLAEQWTKDLIAAMTQARDNGTMKCCVHVTGIQPTAILAEHPETILCWACYRDAELTRTCLSCGRLAGSGSLLGGVESAVRGLAILYSRMLCTPCANPASAGGTFGNGF